MCPSNQTKDIIFDEKMSLKERIFAKRRNRMKNTAQDQERPDINQQFQDRKVSSQPDNSKRESEEWPEESWWSSYGEDLFDTLCLQESAWPNLSLRSPQISYRPTLISKIRETSTEIDASEATVFLALRYLDRFMWHHDIKPHLLEHVAMTTLLVASKVEDSWDVVTKCGKLRESHYVFDGSVLKLEFTICESMQWRLTTPTILTFAKATAGSAIYEEDFKRILEQFLDIALKDKYLSLSLRPSIAGVACVYATWQIQQPGNVPKDILPEKIMGEESSRQSVMQAVDRLIKFRDVVTNKFKRKVDESGLRTDFMKINLNAPPSKQIKIAVI